MSATTATDLLSARVTKFLGYELKPDRGYAWPYDYWMPCRDDTDWQQCDECGQEACGRLRACRCGLYQRVAVRLSWHQWLEELSLMMDNYDSWVEEANACEEEGYDDYNLERMIASRNVFTTEMNGYNSQITEILDAIKNTVRYMKYTGVVQEE